MPYVLYKNAEPVASFGSYGHLLFSLVTIKKNFKMQSLGHHEFSISNDEGGEDAFSFREVHEIDVIEPYLHDICSELDI